MITITKPSINAASGNMNNKTVWAPDMTIVTGSVMQYGYYNADKTDVLTIWSCRNPHHS